MNFIKSPSVTDGVPYNGILVRKNTVGADGKQESSWKAVFGDEARKINPLHDVNTSRNDLILNAISKNDWSDYHRFQAKQHPAWYEEVNGTFQPNKVYYGNLIESKFSALKEAQANNDQKGIETWQKSIVEAIEDFNNAPGIVPYVVGLNHTADLAAQNGVAEPGDDYFDSKWNSPLVSSQGKFEQKMWYENAIFTENHELKQRIETLVAGTFPTSKDVEKTTEPAVANGETVDEVYEPVMAKAETVEVAPETTNLNFETAATDVEEALFKNRESIQSLFLQNLRFDLKPSLKAVQHLYG